MDKISNSSIVPNYSYNFANKSTNIPENNNIGYDYTLPGANSVVVQSIKNNLNINNDTYTFLGTRKVFNNTAYFYQLANGQNVVLVPKKGTTVVKSYVNVGSMNEPDHLRGISHFIEHNLFNGSELIKSGEFFKLVSKMGAETNASTNFALTDYFISSHLLDTADLEEKIKLHADMLQHPKFENSQIEKERGPVTSEIAMVLDDPELISVNKCLKNLSGIKSTSDDLVAGTIKNINNVSRDDIVNYYNTWYTPDNITTVITGEIDPTETIKMLSKYFNTSKSKNVSNRKYEELKPIEAPIRTDLYSPKANSALITIGFAGQANNAPIQEKLAGSALENILNSDNMSRLNKALDHYNAKVYLSKERISNKKDAPTAILLNINCEDNKVEDVLKETFKQIHTISYQPPSNEELHFFKNEAKLMYDQINENSFLLNNIIGSCMIDKDFESMLNSGVWIDYVTGDDVSNYAKKYLDLNKASISVVHPQKEVPKVAFGAKIKKETIDEREVTQGRLYNNIEYSIIDTDKFTNSLLLEYKNQDLIDYKPGVNLILDKMLENGTQLTNKEDFGAKLRNSNIQLGIAYTDGLRVFLDAPKTNMNEALELLKEKLLAPNFSQENFDKAKEHIKSILVGAPKSAYSKLTQELFANTIYGYTNKDILNNIDSITLEDVKKLYLDSIRSSQAHTSMVSSPENVQCILNQLSSLPNVKPFNTDLHKIYSPIKENKIVTDIQEQNQAEIKQAFKFPKSENLKDQVVFSLMNMILGGYAGSRLFQDLREKEKLAYSVNSSLEYVSGSGVCTLSIGTTTDNPDEGSEKLENVAKSLDGFKRHIEQIKNTLCTQEELDAAKKLYTNYILDRVEMDFNKIMTIASSKYSPYGISKTNKTLEIIDSITPLDIQKAANYIFNSNSVISILGSKKTLEEVQKYEQKQF